MHHPFRLPRLPLAFQVPQSIQAFGDAGVQQCLHVVGPVSVGQASTVWIPPVILPLNTAGLRSTPDEFGNWREFAPAKFPNKNRLGTWNSKQKWLCTYHIVCSISSTSEIRQIELNLVPAIIQTHWHCTDKWFDSGSTLVVWGSESSPDILIIQNLKKTTIGNEKLFLCTVHFLDCNLSWLSRMIAF